MTQPSNLSPTDREVCLAISRYGCQCMLDKGHAGDHDPKCGWGNHKFPQASRTPSPASQEEKVTSKSGDLKVVHVDWRDAVNRLDEIFSELQTNFHDQWDWMDAHFYLEVLRVTCEDSTTPAPLPAPAGEVDIATVYKVVTGWGFLCKRGFAALSTKGGAEEACRRYNNGDHVWAYEDPSLYDLSKPSVETDKDALRFEEWWDVFAHPRVNRVVEPSMRLLVNDIARRAWEAKAQQPTDKDAPRRAARCIGRSTWSCHSSGA